jgi:hypothetical protein
MAKEAPKKGGAADPPAPANADPETRARSAAPVAPRYAVGIDLGTTHSVVAAVGLAGLALAAGEAAVAGAGAAAEAVVVEILDIPQAVGPGQVEGRPKLPSFLYQAHPSEYAEGDLVLPWDPRPGVNCGEWARELGRKTPIRLVASAKSWLCHGAVDRRAALLPADAPAEVARISPLAASTQYLAHLRAAWDHAHPEAPLAAQRVVLTVPASFDPAARELTVEAARAAGLPHAVLLEEPQAALYGWIRASGGRWREQVAVGEVILVVDVGGGTTDLSLVAVTAEDGRLALRRLAVGEHILLGGDNMDLALAYQVKAKLEAAGKALEAWQVQALTHACRDAKEALLAATAPETLPIVAPGRGGKLIGGALRTELTRAEVAATLVDGFFPVVPAAARPATPARAGLHVLGLPYAQDAAITRHLAAFLARHAGATAGVPGGVETRPCDFLAPTAILLNGGVFQGGALAERLLAVLNGWLIAAGAPAARSLPGADLDLAVAMGAAYYGYTRAVGGVRIRGGTAAAYYVGVEAAVPAVPGLAPPLHALCVAPFGMEEGAEPVLLAEEFGLVVGEPVRFRFFGSHARRHDEVGTRLASWAEDELTELQELELSLPVEGRRAGEVVPIQLAAAVSEVGTLEIEARATVGEGRWRVAFDVRAGGG